MLIVGGNEEDYGDLENVIGETELLNENWRYAVICGVSSSTHFVLCNSMADTSLEVFT